MLQYLTQLVEGAGQWAYLVVFLGAALESAAFLGLVVPGEALVLLTGFLAAQGVLNIEVLIVTVALGATIGDSLGYEMGRRMGRQALMRYGGRFGLTDARITKADEFFARHGNKAVFLGRFIGFARALVPFLAGSSQMPYRKFLPYNILGAAMWASAITMLGYFLGASWQKAGRWIGEASAVLGGILLCVFLLVWIWRWAVRNETVLRRRWDFFLQNPRVLPLRRRFAPQLAFVQARLTPHSYLGLQLTVGAILLLGFSWLFGGIAEDVVHKDPLTTVDATVSQWFHDHATPAFSKIMLAITHAHDPVPVVLVVIGIAGFLVWRRDRYWLLCLACVVPFGMALNVAMKYAFHRIRPTFDNPLLLMPSYSFPSGHVAGATLVYGFLAALLVARIPAWRWRVMIVLLAFAMVVLVALTRVYLGVHYLSDVLAAFAEGLAWLTLCFTGVNTFWRHREAGKTTAVER